MTKKADQHDAWSPGISSTIPAHLRPQITLYRPENSSVSYTEAKDAADFCGTNAREMVAFTFDRLVTHETLIRVTADLHVPDGDAYEDLGLNLRQMAANIADKHVAPHRGRLKAEFDALCDQIRHTIEARLDQNVFAPARPATATPPKETGGLFGRLFGRKTSTAPAPQPAPDAGQPRDQSALSGWQTELRDLDEGLERACLEALCFVAGGIIKRRGRLPADRDLIARLATHRACNRHGSRAVGEMIQPLIREAAEAGEFTLLPPQDRPVILNVKGASASGKSTLRNLQRELAERLGIPWQEFALVSPDYWRKHLLDYRSLGEDHKYAAVLTGEELEIIDRKLDEYFVRKQQRGDVPHLLIDRFRFDSFVSTAQGEDVGNLLSRFGDRVYIFVMITPPAETVERAWKRGLTTGRFKAVDDLLYHNIEAYTGIPNLFFTWINKTQQKVHFEFLDNGVALGERPRTLAFGWNGRLVVLDAEGLRNLDRYRHVNVDATRPEDVLQSPPEKAGDFLRECLDKVAEVSFLDAEGKAVAAEVRDGRCTYATEGAAERLNLGLTCPEGGEPPPFDAKDERFHTLGAWPGDP
ncbi:zeta toxin family protein [Paracoccus sp. TK19116]|uniref:Zeta toxin family protein n=1 Tax=Paracoccus albicereus TaxID=2922394 RepID=A0ABT1MWA8_9RHOB|nr:zeta toxin family protein [Paracoccus albicereus]MCQ0971628.1 zeta toxin family protein [Paracoccus albicereus]